MLLQNRGTSIAIDSLKNFFEYHISKFLPFLWLYNLIYSMKQFKNVCLQPEFQLYNLQRLNIICMDNNT